MSTCGCKRAAVKSVLQGYAILALHNDIFLIDIVGYDRLKFS